MDINPDMMQKKKPIIIHHAKRTLFSKKLKMDLKAPEGNSPQYLEELKGLLEKSQMYQMNDNNIMYNNEKIGSLEPRDNGLVRVTLYNHDQAKNLGNHILAGGQIQYTNEKKAALYHKIFQNYLTPKQAKEHVPKGARLKTS